MPMLWIVSIVVLWVFVLFETALLILLLKGLGQLRESVERASHRVALPDEAGLAVGEEGPSLVALDDEGRQVQLANFRGKPCILAFVSPGCEACASTIDTLNVFLTYKQEIGVFVVGGGNSRENQAYAAQHQARMPILTSRPGSGKELYRVQGIPFVFILDEMGIIRAKGVVNTYEHLERLLTIASVSLPVSQ